MQREAMISGCGRVEGMRYRIGRVRGAGGRKRSKYASKASIREEQVWSSQTKSGEVQVLAGCGWWRGATNQRRSAAGFIPAGSIARGLAEDNAESRPTMHSFAQLQRAGRE